MDRDGLIYGDAMAFFNLPGDPPASETTRLHIACVTAAPPFVMESKSLCEIVKKFKGDIEAQPGLKIASCSNDIKNVSSDTCNVVLGLQHPPVDGPIDELFNLGVRIVQIVYEGENIFGGGFAADKVKLKAAGRELISSLDRLGMILDLSHAGSATAFDAIQFIEERKLKVPVMVSHTGIREIYNHPRNLPMYLLKNIANMGGVVGIYTLSFGLSESDDPESFNSFLQHLSTAIKLLPLTQIVIGSDGVYRNIPREIAFEHFKKMEASINKSGAFRARFPTESGYFTTTNKMANVRNLMDRIGVAAPWAEAIVGGNLMRFLYKSLPSFKS